MPLVSVIIGTYNAERYLRLSLESVLAQTFRDFEVVVVDDASTDRTLAILEEYGDRVRVIRRQANSRTCELPRYQGAAQAEGVYCAFLDADDLWEPDKLEKQVAFLEAHPDIPLVHTYFRIIDDEGRPQHVRHEGVIPPTGPCARALLHHCFITISSVAVRKATWLEAMEEEAITDFGMDQDFFLRIARHHEIGFIPEVLGSYRRSAVSVGQHKWRRNPRNVNTLERFLAESLYEGLATRKEMVNILADAYLENAEAHRHGGYPWHTLYFCLNGLRHRPFRAGFWVSMAKALLRPFPRKRR